MRVEPDIVYDFLSIPTIDRDLLVQSACDLEQKRSQPTVCSTLMRPFVPI